MAYLVVTLILAFHLSTSYAQSGSSQSSRSNGTQQQVVGGLKIKKLLPNSKRLVFKLNMVESGNCTDGWWGGNEFRVSLKLWRDDFPNGQTADIWSEDLPSLASGCSRKFNESAYLIRITSRQLKLALSKLAANNRQALELDNVKVLVELWELDDVSSPDFMGNWVQPLDQLLNDLITETKHRELVTSLPSDATLDSKASFSLWLEDRTALRPAAQAGVEMEQFDAP